MNPSDEHLELIARARGQVAGADDRTRAGAPGSSNVAGSTTARAGPVGLVAAPGYEIVRELQRGGQGVVFLATQTSTSRQVALKVLREGRFANELDRVRFQQEVRILASLRHPNIVTIHDSGTVGGVTYFVMDYIEGPPLDAWVRANRPTVDETLRVFLAIADAVNAAHLRGIIHRDLKPSNVRLGRDGRPRVLDFGLAKSIDAGLGAAAAESGLTRTGDFIGSLPWASPEQAEGRHDAIDVRTDVYALGLLLYQMLTDELPYRLSGTPREILGVIVEAQPKPLRTVRPDIDADLETIALKCLAKDPQRRYQTAGEVRRDVERYLAGLPIEARRDSMSYVLKKYAARHKAVVTLGAALLIAVVAGLGVSLTLWRQAVADSERAAAARRAAESETAKALAVLRFLNEELLATADPQVEPNRDLRVREALDAAADRIAGRFESEPLVEAAIQTTIGSAYQGLGEFSAAERHLSRALELCERAGASGDASALEAMSFLALVYHGQGRFDDAEPLYARVLESRRGSEDDSELVEALNNVAGNYIDQRKLDQAEPLLMEAIDMGRRLFGPDYPGSFVATANLASLYEEQQRFDDAERLYLRVLPALRRVLGEESLYTLTAMNNLAALLSRKGSLDEAEPLLRETLETRRRILGNQHPHTLSTAYNLGSLLMRRERFEAAEPFLREALEGAKVALGRGHANTLRVMLALADANQRQGRLADAEALFRETVAAARASAPPGHHVTATARTALGACLSEMERFAEAETELLAGYEGLRAALSENDPRVLNAVRELADLYDRSGQADKARAFHARLSKTAQPAQNDAGPSDRRVIP
jgi:tetratricopeptide (TPR) repeat protein/predicted Ser/Thr protein kinase